MKHHYVKTSNHQRFMGSVAFLGERGSREAGILLLTGEPGTGKTTTVDNWGSEVDALYLEGIPGMSLSFLKANIRHELGMPGAGRFDEFKALVDYLADRAVPIVLDEAQHGLPNKAEVIEYLRRAAEKAGVVLVLVCHSSERAGFHKPAHIRTRVGHICELAPSSADDTATLLAGLCEVAVSREVAEHIHRVSDGLPRRIGNAIPVLERVAAKKGLERLELGDIAGITLCEDWGKKLRGIK